MKKTGKKGPSGHATQKALVYPIRLNRYIAHCGVCSRRAADKLIAEGRISINGAVVRTVGSVVQRGDRVFYGRKALLLQSHVYLLLNKPKGYITTTKDEKGRPTVMDLVGREEGLFPVGRLDRNTTGLLLFTNNGAFMQRLTHPSYAVEKIYEITLQEPLTQKEAAAIRKGVVLEDGVARVDELHIISSDGRVAGLKIHSGKNRIVRRIFESLGHTVTKLDRVSYGTLTKKNLARGRWRALSEREVHLLLKVRGDKAP